MIKTTITIEYEGFISSQELGRLLMLASSFEAFNFLEVNQPGGISTYSCKKKKQED